MIMRSVPQTQAAQIHGSVPASCAPWAARTGRPLRRKAVGMGYVNPPTGYSGAVSVPGGGSANVNLSTEQLVQGLAVEQGTTYTPGMCDSGGVAGANCAGYLQSFIALVENGTMQYNPSNGSWSINTTNPKPPSAAAAAAYSASAGQSPFATNITASTYTGSTVYSRPQESLAQLLAANGISSPTIVQPSPSGQSTEGTLVNTNPLSALSQSSGVTTSTGSTVNAGTGDIIPGVDNSVLFIAGGVGVVLLVLMMSGR